MCENKRVHVQDLTWQDRLLCGRTSTRQQIVALMAATAYPNLCNKCRQRLWVAWMHLSERARPKPGLQLTLFQEY
jgi:low temperature requirement protein LtrA